MQFSYNIAHRIKLSMEENPTLLTLLLGFEITRAQTYISYSKSGYKKHYNYALSSFLWKNIQLHDSQRSQLLSSHKTKMVPRQSTKFCDRGRTWPANTSSDNTERKKS